MLVSTIGFMIALSDGSEFEGAIDKFLAYLKNIIGNDYGIVLSRPTAQIILKKDDESRSVFNLFLRNNKFDFNNYVESQEENDQYFEYKNILRNAQRTKEMAKQILTDYKKGLIHHPEESFGKILVAG